MAEYSKPLPVIREETKEFWQGCKRHELVIQRCAVCGTYRFPPQPMCYECNSMEVDWVKVDGKGVIYSFIVAYHHNQLRPAPRSFRSDIPYAVVLVELPNAGKIHLVSNVVDCDLKDIRIGMPVEVVFDDVVEHITLPKFKPCQ